MKDYQERVVAEKVELDKKVVALFGFIQSSPTYNNLDGNQRSMLIQQLEAMNEYSRMLGLRIEAF